MNKSKVLLVEDHLNWQKILKSRVEQAFQNIGRAGTVKLCSNFIEACQALEFEGPWHLLITDIGLGNHDESRHKLGIQLVDMAHESQLHCIVVSGTLVVTNHDVRDLLKEHGIRDFFSKQNFESKQFVDTVESILKMTLRPSSQAKCFNNFPKIDQARFRDLISEHFSEGELRSLCFDLKIDYENWSSMSKMNKVEELITYLVHRDRLFELQVRCRELRPFLKW